MLRHITNKGNNDRHHKNTGRKPQEDLLIQIDGTLFPDGKEHDVWKNTITGLTKI